MAQKICLTLAGQTLEFSDKDAETLVTAIRKAAAGGSSHAIVSGGRMECMVSTPTTANNFSGQESQTATADVSLTEY